MISTILQHPFGFSTPHKKKIVVFYTRKGFRPSSRNVEKRGNLGALWRREARLGIGCERRDDFFWSNKGWWCLFCFGGGYI